MRKNDMGKNGSSDKDVKENGMLEETGEKNGIGKALKSKEAAGRVEKSIAYMRDMEEKAWKEGVGNAFQVLRGGRDGEDEELMEELKALGEMRILGAPDMVIEIVSPSNWKVDVIKKKDKYEKASVREYWMIFPKEQRVVVYLFDRGEEIKNIFE